LCEREDASKVATQGRTDDVNLVRAKRIDEAGQPFDTETAKTGRPAAARRASLPICTVGRREAPAPRSITGARLVPVPSTDLVVTGLEPGWLHIAQRYERPGWRVEHRLTGMLPRMASRG